MDKSTLKSLFNKALDKNITAANAAIIVDMSYVLYLSMHGAYGYIKNEYGLENDPDFDVTTIGDFREAFKSKFRNSIYYTAKNALQAKDINLGNVILATDCPKSRIWRNKLFPEYKIARRMHDRSQDAYCISKAFAYAHDVIIPDFLANNDGAKQIAVDTAEADDIIAALVRLLPDDITKLIIANDKDYIQLLTNDNIILSNCQNKITSLLTESFKNSKLEEANKVLTCKEFLLKKIIMGDKSDGISPILPRCGDSTALKLVLNPDKLKEHLADKEVRAKFNLNRKLIDMAFIPDTIIQAVKEQI